MWESVLEPGLVLLDSRGDSLTGFLQELAHHALHAGPGNVLWCDGAHGFNPHDFSELNLVRGFPAEEHARRLLVRRCLTPFQWYTALSRHVLRDLQEAETRLVVAHPFDRPLSTQELADWEQEDYVRFLVPHLKAVARERRVPVVLGVDMARWWRSHPVLAQVTHDGVDARWGVERVGGRWRLAGGDGRVLDPQLRHRATLLDYMDRQVRDGAPVPFLVRAGTGGRPRRTRIVYPVGGKA